MQRTASLLLGYIFYENKKNRRKGRFKKIIQIRRKTREKHRRRSERQQQRCIILCRVTESRRERSMWSTATTNFPISLLSHVFLHAIVCTATTTLLTQVENITSVEEILHSEIFFPRMQTSLHNYNTSFSFWLRQTHREKSSHDKLQCKHTLFEKAALGSVFSHISILSSIFTIKNTFSLVFLFFPLPKHIFPRFVLSDTTESVF